MTAFVCLQRGATALTVSVPPMRVNRHGFAPNAVVLRWSFLEGTDVDTVETLLGDAERSVSFGLNGDAIVTEWPGASSQLGPVTLRMAPGGSTVLCMFGPKGQQAIEERLGPYPDTLADGSPQNPKRQRCSVELTLYTI